MRRINENIKKAINYLDEHQHYLLLGHGRGDYLCDASNADAQLHDEVIQKLHVLRDELNVEKLEVPYAKKAPKLHPLHRDQFIADEYQGAVYQSNMQCQEAMLAQLALMNDEESSNLLLAGVSLLLSRWSLEQSVCLDVAKIELQQSPDKYYRHKHECRIVDCLPTYTVGQLLASIENNPDGNKPIGGVSSGKIHFSCLRGCISEMLPGDFIACLNGWPSVTSETYDIALHINYNQHCISLAWLYNSNFFSERTLISMGRALEKLLHGMIFSSGQVIEQLPLSDISVGSAQSLTNICADSSSFSFVHEKIERQANLSPDAIAIRCQDQQLTYGQLNRRANQLACFLLGKIDSPETIVPICIGRSVDMLVAVLAVLKAGGVYVPLDPSHPSKRLDYVIIDCDASLILTEKQWAKKLSAYSEIICCIDDHQVQHDCECLPDTNISPKSIRLKSKHLAYIIYTSGSTGMPKGVCIEHFAFSHCIIGMQFYLPEEAVRSWLAVITLSFDLSVIDLFVPLASGGNVVLATEADSIDGEALQALLQHHNIGVFQATPSTWQMLLSSGWQGKNDLVALSGGEALTAQLADDLLDKCHQLYNGYGPTETTVCSLFKLVADDGDYIEQLSIGHGLPNTTHYILDREFSPVLAGMVGELYIGGPGLARGYLNRAELTSKHFIESPFKRERKERLYKTGDLVRLLPSGNIQYLGRIDTQVKLRGYRIELGEIESLLHTHKFVAQAAAAIKVVDQQAVLAAYIKSHTAPLAGDIDEIRQWLKDHLPHYMIPAVIMPMPALPLTGSGKIDRNALPIPQLEQSSPHVAANDELETAILSIFKSRFKQPSIGVTDNFFELGGNSLLITQLASDIRQKLGYQLSIDTLYDCDSPRRLSDFLKVNGKILDQSTEEPITPSVDELLPLTDLQQGMWLSTQKTSSASNYNIPLYFSCDGNVDGQRVEKYFNQLIARHSSLRASFFMLADGQLRQRILPDRYVALTEIDLSDYDDKKQQLALESLFTTEIDKPFDLEKDVLLRTVLLKLGEQRYHFLLTVHHIIADEVSCQELLREFALLYKGEELQQFNNDRYINYLHWRCGVEHTHQAKVSSAYWKQKLSGIPSLHGLPLDRPRPSIQTFSGAVYEQHFDSELVASLKVVASDNEVTLFMLIHSIFCIFISHLSSESEVVLGVPIIDRNYGEFDQTIGCLLNTSVIRANVNASSDFLEMLKQSKNLIGEALLHKGIALSELVNLIDFPIDSSHTPLFQIMLAQQNHDYHKLLLPGLEMSQYYPQKRLVKFDLLANICERENSLTIRWEYSSDLWASESIARMSSQFSDLTRNIIAESPEISLAKLSLLRQKSWKGNVTENTFQLSESDETQLNRWNATDRNYPIYASVQERFKAQVKLSPESNAVIYEDQILSYQTLDEHSNQVAHALQAEGIEIGDRVALCMNRSHTMLVAILGILKAGAVYVPLDPEYPQSRLLWMLSDANASVILTESSVSNVISSSGTSLILLDNPASWSSYPKTEPIVTIQSSDLAYVIYTSGSTGKPKGVMVEHGNLLHLAHSLQQVLSAQHFTGSYRWALNAGLVFDASIKAISQLLFGVELHVLSDSLRKDAERMRDYLSSQSIDLLDCTPSQLNSMMTSGVSISELPGLIIGGEAIDEALWLELSQSQKALNVYGPTECTVNTTAAVVLDNTLPTIGKPLDNVKVYVVNEQLQQVPIGEEGELCIGGMGVSRGYLNKPKLTAEKFIEVSWAEGRLYRTGDRVRWLNNGQLGYQGRFDEQVKIRGYRIELGEIEHVISRHPKVSRAVVGVKSLQRNQVLVAFVLLNAKESSAEKWQKALTAYLSEHLPSYMVPPILQLVEHLPLTQSGKVDKPALLSSVTYQENFVEPETETEQALAVMWQDILGIDNIGATNNFFQLGGQSILITKMASSIRKIFSVEVSIDNIYNNPTIKSLSEKVDTAIALKNSEQGFGNFKNYEEFEL